MQTGAENLMPIDSSRNHPDKVSISCLIVIFILCSVFPIDMFMKSNIEFPDKDESTRSISKLGLESFDRLYDFTFDKVVRSNSGNLYGILSTKSSVTFDNTTVYPPVHTSGDNSYTREYCVIASFNETQINWIRVYNSTASTGSGSYIVYDVKCENLHETNTGIKPSRRYV